jgi:hypothetical protein
MDTKQTRIRDQDQPQMDADSRRFCFALRVSFKERNRDARTGIFNLTDQISGPRINLRQSAFIYG